ncbi:phage portal protein [Virgibacillus halophilus]|uniref:Phage portal protein n=1 Tax=Tigheibacillus halophilus TaxID=361280 RepID=A0ABU5C624_9BACI|nr:phage portal protein [Virgibacillus halophilus]
MAQVNEFETAHYNYESNTKQRFSDEANTHYTYSSSDNLVNNLDDLSEMIQHHRQHQRPRLQELQEYYKGNNSTILRNKRRKEDHLADHRATHNFAKYVSQFIQGYMVGVPLKTTYTKGDAINEKIRDMNRENDADEHNSDLVLDQSIYGRAYELLYRNKQDDTRFTILNVLETFVIYDDTVEMNPIVGVRYIGNRFQDDVTVYVYTDNEIVTYKMDDAFNLTEDDRKPHYFKGVPIIEYDNNSFRQGDFENAMNLIDLYDAAQSDTANYMSDLNDAMLKIKGSLDLDVEEAKKMKEANIIMLQSEQSTDGRFSDVDADYIYKKYDVQGTEAYKDRVFNNILLFTSIPNLLDDKKRI